MSIFSEQKQDSTDPMVLFNTGTIWDLMTGTYQLGVDDKYYLNGGLGSFITGMHGGGNMYKSTFMDSLIVGLLRIYRDVDSFTFDTEGSKGAERVARFTNDETHSYGIQLTEIMERMVIKTGVQWDLSSVYEFIKEICDLKKKHSSKVKIKTPFLNPLTEQPIVTWLPTVIFIDSLTELECAEEEEMLKRGMDDKKNKTIYMVDGNKKTMLIRKLRKLAAEYGLIIVCSAHKGKNIEMDSYGPPSKQLQHMKQSDKLKGVGSKFEFLTHILAQTTRAVILLDSGKAALYKDGTTSDTDLNGIDIKIQRNKSNASGLVNEFVISQEYGLLDAVNNYHFLRSNGYCGLNGNKQVQQLALLPDVSITRNSIRSKVKGDYRLCRALELTAQFEYIKKNWNLSGQVVDFTQDMKDVYEDIKKSDVLTIERVLDSTGYWNYKDYGREYLSLYDVLIQLAQEKLDRNEKVA